MHPAINLISVGHLASSMAPAGPLPVKRRGLFRRAGGAVLDRVGDRAAAFTAGEVEQLRDELERTRAELKAEITLLRAELEARDAPGD